MGGFFVDGWQCVFVDGWMYCFTEGWLYLFIDSVVIYLQSGIKHGWLNWLIDSYIGLQLYGWL